MTDGPKQPNEPVNTDALLMEIRTGFSTYCAGRELHYPLALSGTVSYEITKELNSMIAIQSNPDCYSILIHPLVLPLYRSDPVCIYFMIMHELRHLIQISDFAETQNVVNLYPLEAAYANKANKEGIKPAMNPQRAKDLKHQVFNIAADAALHEDLGKLFGSTVLEKTRLFCRDIFMPAIGMTPEEDDGIVTVEGLEKLFKRKLPRDRDWLFYTNEYISYLAQDIEEDPEGNFFKKVSSPGVSVKLIESQGFDGHDFDPSKPPGDGGVQIESAKREARKLSEFSKNKKNGNDSHIGNGLGDDDFTDDGRKKLSRAIIEMVDRIRISMKRASKNNEPGAYSYNRVHNLLPGVIPGKKPSPKIAKKKKAVIVVDTSGSMWQREFLEQMVSFASRMKRQGKLEALYCCDTVIREVDLSRPDGRITLTGRGGSSWTVEHNTQILKKLGVDGDKRIKRAVDIFYLTDEMVSGLDEATKDKRVKLHTINIPNALSGNK